MKWASGSSTRSSAAVITRNVRIGTRVYSLTSDDQYLDHVGDNFEPGLVKMATNFIGKKDIVLDIGANIGCTTLLFADLAFQVHAFEPVPSTFKLLKNNVQASGHKNVYLYNLGLGSEPGVSAITFSPSNRSGGFVSNYTQASAGHITEGIVLTRLDDLHAKQGFPSIDFIKIDVEGFEPQVLIGAGSVIGNFKPVVMMELNHWCLNAFQRTSVPEFFDLCRDLFPVLYAVNDSDHTVADLHKGDQSYIVMYEHILQWKWLNLIGAFHRDQILRLTEEFKSR